MRVLSFSILYIAFTRTVMRMDIDKHSSSVIFVNESIIFTQKKYRMSSTNNELTLFTKKQVEVFFTKDLKTDKPSNRIIFMFFEEVQTRSGKKMQALIPLEKIEGIFIIGKFEKLSKDYLVAKTNHDQKRMNEIWNIVDTTVSREAPELLLKA